MSVEKQKGISIVFPHLISQENDEFLALTKQMIKETTVGPYEILYLASTPRPDLVYEGFNYLVKQAKYEAVMLLNTDIVLAHGWDEHISVENADWVSLRVVESGNIPSASSMISRDFGKTPDKFDYHAFNEFVEEQRRGKTHAMEKGFVWFCPSVVKKSKFLELGGFDTEPAFPHPSDIAFKKRAERAGWRFMICNYSWAYHFQQARANEWYRDKWDKGELKDTVIAIREEHAGPITPKPKPNPTIIFSPTSKTPIQEEGQNMEEQEIALDVRGNTESDKAQDGESITLDAAIEKGISQEIITVCSNLNISIAESDTETSLKKKISETVRSRSYKVSPSRSSGGAKSEAPKNIQEVINELNEYTTKGTEKKIHQVEEFLKARNIQFTKRQITDTIYMITFAEGGEYRCRVGY
jgi:hypothetical protein